MLSAARNLGLELHVINASSEGDFDAAFTSGPPKVNPGDVTQVQPTVYHLERRLIRAVLRGLCRQKLIEDAQHLRVAVAPVIENLEVVLELRMTDMDEHFERGLHVICKVLVRAS